jgi:hypothetical protein
MLKNPNIGPNAVFVPTRNGAFRRFNAATGKPMDAGPGDAHGLFDRDGKIHFGELPAAMAQDQMPDFRPDAPAKAAAVGARREQMDQSDDGPLTKEHAAQLSDLAFKAGASEDDLRTFQRVLAQLCGGGDDPTSGAATDQKSGRITRDAAAKIWDIAKDQLSPADLAELTERLKACLAGEGEAMDAPPNFVGKPLTGGGMVTGDESARQAGVARQQFLRDHPYMANVGHAPPYGEHAPPSRARRQAARLALDDASRQGGGGGGQMDADLREALASVAKIGRAY